MKSPTRHELSPNSAMKTLFLLFVVAAFGLSIPVSAFDSPTLDYSHNPLRIRFSEEAITAIKDAKDCMVIPLKERPPLPKYNKATKKESIEPVLRWFDARAREGKPLSEAAYQALADLLLNPANQNWGCYCVTDVAVAAIRIQMKDQVGYIVLNTGGLISVHWGNASQSTLLNKTGKIVLQQWVSDYVDEEPPSSVANGKRFPPGTEISNSYTKHVWVVQRDGTVKKRLSEPCAPESSEEEPVVHAIPLLVEVLSENPLWQNGFGFSLQLPADTSVSRLVAAYLKNAQFKFGRIKDYDIEEVVTTPIPTGSSSPPYTIVRISSDQGGKFLIFQFHKSDWWTKSFDVRDEYSRAEAQQSGKAISLTLVDPQNMTFLPQGDHVKPTIKSKGDGFQLFLPPVHTDIIIKKEDLVPADVSRSDPMELSPSSHGLRMIDFILYMPPEKTTIFQSQPVIVEPVPQQ